MAAPPAPGIAAVIGKAMDDHAKAKAMDVDNAKHSPACVACSRPLATAYSVPLPCSHKIHYECARIHAESRTKMKTNVTCPFPGCNVVYNFATLAQTDQQKHTALMQFITIQHKNISNLNVLSDPRNHHMYGEDEDDEAVQKLRDVSPIRLEKMQDNFMKKVASILMSITTLKEDAGKIALYRYALRIKGDDDVG